MNGRNNNSPSTSCRMIIDPNEPRYAPRPTPPPAKWRELQYEVRTTTHPVVPGFIIAGLPGGFTGNLPAVANTQFHQWLQRNPPLVGGPGASPRSPVVPPAQLPWQGMQLPPQQPLPHQQPPRQPQMTPKDAPPPASPVSTPRRSVDTRIRDNTSYGEILKGRPHSAARPPLNIDISIAEICTFFPSWFINPLVILRAMRNGFTRNTLADLQIGAVGCTSAGDRKKTEDRLQQQISRGGKLEQGTEARWDRASYVQRVGLQNDLTANYWKQRDGYGPKENTVDWDDFELVGVSAAVPQANWPTGDDKLLLTRCLEFASANQGLHLTTHHWAWIIQNHLSGVMVPPAPAGPNANRDTAAVGRLFG
ncbi:hypothetical protein LTR78_008498 [Recurvomyces mirabilis]|uniref:Uncharacterized protein n=1 Tax=Recurvomyces mirabilis TaxID=574656 RepID=A0AAE0TR53_9PEZI|nr:hypothetical protein LTR78_008498 [Recurvomyces mirabilis]KAK5156250.1 hypothetical protein LTS14_005137 [Recurvomyces mirabilis]